ncbi:hypothetical protein [Kocuria sp. CCUG 69068]|uniref:hypothetical protein n=1 Tax=Kocuria sp. CCUG 69068 TaxID=2043138 RepID=UPI001E4FEF0D
MSFSRDPGLPYSAFTQACRAFKPSELIPAIAQASASLGEPPYPDLTCTGERGSQPF